MSDGAGTWTAEARREQRELREHIRGWITGYRMGGAGPWASSGVWEARTSLHSRRRRRGVEGAPRGALTQRSVTQRVVIALSSPRKACQTTS